MTAVRFGDLTVCLVLTLSVFSPVFVYLAKQWATIDNIGQKAVNSVQTNYLQANSLDAK